MKPSILLGKLLGLFEALAAAQALGFGAAGLVIFSQAGGAGLGTFLLLALGSLVLTAVFLGLAALLAAGSPERGRARVLALSLVVWFVAVVVFDVAALPGCAPAGQERPAGLAGSLLGIQVRHRSRPPPFEAVQGHPGTPQPPLHGIWPPLQMPHILIREEESTMLQLFNYDLQKPVKNYPALQRGVEKIGGGIHILNGPWIIDTGKSPQAVLAAVITSIKAATPIAKKNGRDKLLVFPVQMGEISQGSTPHPHPIKPHPGVRVLAVSYHFRNPSAKTVSSTSAEDRRRALIAALSTLGATCHPLNALCFVKTDQSAHEVRLALVNAVPLTPSDELVVAEVDMKAKLDGRLVKGAEVGLTPEHHDWLVKAGVLFQTVL